LTPRWSAALVTGASSGIGEAFARRLAAEGVADLVLVARREARLTALATELGARHGTSCEVLVADLADADDRARVEARLAEPAPRPRIDLLVNNAGLGTTGRFHALPADGEEHEIDVNVIALVRLTRAALGSMVDRARGTIINVSSLAGEQPSPGAATYAATKAFVTLFGETLHLEARGTGVTVTTVLPGYTRTEFADHSGAAADGRWRPPSFIWLAADQVATAALDAAAHGRALCIPGRGYRVVAALTSPLPRGTRRWLVGRLARG